MEKHKRKIIMLTLENEDGSKDEIPISSPRMQDYKDLMSIQNSMAEQKFDDKTFVTLSEVAFRLIKRANPEFGDENDSLIKEFVDGNLITIYLAVMNKQGVSEDKLSEIREQQKAIIDAKKDDGEHKPTT